MMTKMERTPMDSLKLRLLLKESKRSSSYNLLQTTTIKHELLGVGLTQHILNSVV